MQTAIKKRRPKGQRGQTHDKLPPKTSKDSKKGISLPVAMLSIIAVAFMLFVGLAIYNPEYGVHKNVARFLSSITSKNSPGDYHKGKLVYAIMMDAGSTGSRILVFTFSKSPTDGSLKLLDEFFKEVKPGISSFATNPQQAADSINSLFDDARQIIPEDEWARTPASLKATAGLRMLPKEQQDALLDSITKVFANSGFLVKSDAVSIINGHAEGLYLWTTINFLLDKLHRDLNETVAVVDMGGGSTQVALVPLEQATIQNAPVEDIQSLHLLGQPAKFYIHSYLGIGLMALRLGFLRYTNATFDMNEDLFLSQFIQQGEELDWDFQGRKYHIKGISLPGDSSEELQEEQPLRYKNCRKAIAKMVKDRKIHQLEEMKRRTLYAVSYYFDRAVDANLIEESTGGSIRVRDYCTSAEAACAKPVSGQPFACIDLTYFCAVLEEGFGLAEDHVINLKKKIDGHETSWALGAALFDLDSDAKQPVGK